MLEVAVFLFTVAANAVALAHLFLVVWLVIGGPLAARWPSLAVWHLAALVPTAAVFAVGADCPLTVLEKFFLRVTERGVYEGGFIEHHLVEPLHPAGITPTIQVLIVAAWLVPTVVGHGLRIHRKRTARSVVVGPGPGPGGVTPGRRGRPVGGTTF